MPVSAESEVETGRAKRGEDKAKVWLRGLTGLTGKEVECEINGAGPFLLGLTCDSTLGRLPLGIGPLG